MDDVKHVRLVGRGVDGFFGLRVGRRYFKVRDISRHPLLYSERNGHGYRRLVRVGMWEAGVKTDA